MAPVDTNAKVNAGGAMAVTTTLDALTAKTVTVTVIRTVIVEVFKNVVTLVTRNSLIGTNPIIVARRAP